MFSRSLAPSESPISTYAIQLSSKSSSLVLSREATRRTNSSRTPFRVGRPIVVSCEHGFSHEATRVEKKLDESLRGCNGRVAPLNRFRQATAATLSTIGDVLHSHQSYPSFKSKDSEDRSPRATSFITATKAVQSKTFKKTDNLRRICKSLLLVATLSLTDMSIFDSVAHAAIPGGRYYVAAALPEILVQPNTAVATKPTAFEVAVASEASYDLPGSVLASPPLATKVPSEVINGDTLSLKPQKVQARSLVAQLPQKHGRIHSHKTRAVTYRQLGSRLGGLPWWQEQQRLREFERREFWICNDSASYVSSCQSSPAVASLPHASSGFSSWIDEQMDQIFPAFMPWDVRPSHAVPMAAAVAATHHDGLFRSEAFEPSSLAIARGRNVATSASSAVAAVVSRSAGSASVAAASAGVAMGEHGMAAAGAMAMAGTNASVFRASMAATMKLASISGERRAWTSAVS